MPKDEQEIVVTIGLKEWTRQCIEQALSEHSRKCPIVTSTNSRQARPVHPGIFAESYDGGTINSASFSI